MAIKEAIKAIVIDVIPRGKIVFGGHPAITPLVSTLVDDFFPELADRAILFQSLYFDGQFPVEVKNFPTVRYVERAESGLGESLNKMRRAMIGAYDFDAAVFVGGMEGVVAEYEMFRRTHATATLIPLASTGAAALEIFQSGEFLPELEHTISFSTIYRRMIR